MLSRRTFTLAGLACAASGCGLDRLSVAPAHSKLAESAAKEGALVINATSDQFGVEDLLNTFKALYPGIAIEYQRPNSIEQHNSILQAARLGQPMPDFTLSSAMDLQFKLANDGFAQTYESPEKAHLPSWAVWNNQAYAITAEPIVFSYNKNFIAARNVPHSHDELADMLRRDPNVYRGKIATYDPEKSGSGYLYFTQDLLLSRDTLEFYRVLARTKPRFYVSGLDIINRISRGEYWLGYNMVSSYSLNRQAHDPSIGVVFPNDYTLVMSRIAIIPTGAQHPAAGKLFLDFLLSELGQRILASYYIRPIRNGIEMEGSAPSSPEVLRPIHLGPGLLANLDEFRRRTVLREWRHTFDSLS